MSANSAGFIFVLAVLITIFFFHEKKHVQPVLTPVAKPTVVIVAPTPPVHRTAPVKPTKRAPAKPAKPAPQVERPTYSIGGPGSSDFE
jgi:hypothetical protein